MWDKGWDDLFSKNEWGKYPDVEVVRFFERNFKKDLDFRKNCKVLELGCGPGANLFYLAREGFSAFGIDGSEVAINRAKERLDKEGLKVDLAVGDILTLPYEDNQYDAILDCECIYANSMKDSKKIMEEAYRVLKPGGKFFSLTFATGTYGDGNGDKLEGERNTYTKIHEGALHSEYGIIRFTDEDEITELYGNLFEVDSVEYIQRSSNNQKNHVKEWLIACRKK